MAEKKIVQLDFTARDLSTGEVFDTTSKEVAEKEGIFEEQRKFKPLMLVLGKGEMLKALEEEIQKMQTGEQKKIVLRPEQAFGERKAENIAVMPLQNFKDNKMMPFPGMVFEANGMRGKVQSVSGGRVRVDFNHPLAGKTIEYEIKLLKELTDKKEKIAALYEKFLPLGEEKDRRFELKGEELSVWLPKQLDLKNAEPLKKVLEKIFTENIEGIKKVSFIESTEKKAEAAESKEAETVEKKETEKAIEQAEKPEKEKAAEQKRSLVQSKKNPQSKKERQRKSFSRDVQ